ncbi:MAG: peroxiredoxin family protein [Planctomycetaceae bacterium]
MTGVEMPRGLPAWVRWFLPLVAVALGGLVWWKQGQDYESFPIPDKAFVRQAPVFQLHDQSMKLLRLQRYIGRHKFLVAFIDASEGADRSEVLKGLKSRFSEFERTGGLIVGVTAGRPAENRAAIERLEGLPFVLLSDLNNLEVHREWGAVKGSPEQAVEGIVVVDRAGWIRFQHFGPDELGTVEQWLAELRAVR